MVAACEGRAVWRGSVPQLNVFSAVFSKFAWGTWHHGEVHLEMEKALPGGAHLRLTCSNEMTLEM